MNCKEIEIKLYDYIQGSVSESQRASIANHIRTCNDCKMQLHVMEATYSVIDEQKSLTASDDMDSIVLNALAGADTPPTIYMETFRTIQKIAAIVIIAISIGVGILMGNNLYQPEQYSYESNFWSNELYIDNTGSFEVESIIYEQ